MKLSMRHELPFTTERFWEVFLDPAMTERMFREALDASVFEIRSEEGDRAGVYERVSYNEQPIDAPGPVKKLMGTSAGTTERGTFDAAKGVWTFTMTPETMPDKIKVAGTIRVEPNGTDGCVRVFELEGSVKILGVGKIFEGFMEKQARAAQDATAAWMASKVK